MNHNYKFGPIRDMYYIESNANICMFRWTALVFLVLAIGDVTIKPLLVALGAFLALVGMVQQYWFNSIGCRMLITKKMNYKYSKHYREFLKQFK